MDSITVGTVVAKWTGEETMRGVVSKILNDAATIGWDSSEDIFSISDILYNSPWKDVAQVYTDIEERGFIKAYDCCGECISMRITDEEHKKKFWVLQPPHEFLTENGYTISKENSESIRQICDGWGNTCVWFMYSCIDRKEIGDEISKWIIGPLKEVAGDIKTFKDFIIPEKYFGKLVGAVVDKEITTTMGKEILQRMYDGEDFRKIIDEDKYKVSSNDDMLDFVREVINDNPDQVAELLSGKDKVIGWLVGQVMKKSKGQANAADVNKTIKEELNIK